MSVKIYIRGWSISRFSRDCTLEGLGRVEDELIRAVPHDGAYKDAQYAEQGADFSRQELPYLFKSRSVARWRRMHMA